jgi:hypothetical protein
VQSKTGERLDLKVKNLTDPIRQKLFQKFLEFIEERIDKDKGKSKLYSENMKAEIDDVLKLIIEVNQIGKIPENSRFHTVCGTLIALIEYSDGSNFDKKSLKHKQ